MITLRTIFYGRKTIHSKLGYFYRTIMKSIYFEYTN
jgi:hypothetical protein